jgi:hypothetical protein
VRPHQSRFGSTPKLQANQRFGVSDELETSLTISFMDVRETFPFIDPERLNPNEVLEILLHVFQQTTGFVDRGHETNNRETAWVNGYLYRLRDNGMDGFVVDNIGSSVDKMAALREQQHD